MNTFGKYLFALLCLIFSAAVFAEEQITVPIYLVAQKGGEGKAIGTVTIKKAQCGVLFTPNLTDLKPGPHGFHIHQNPSCDDFGNAAGAHLDPNHTNAHGGPYGSGHLGDLPFLWVGEDGKAILPVLEPRLALNDVKGHSLMIHRGGDNYSDDPEKNGGGGGRIACGVIK